MARCPGSEQPPGRWVDGLLDPPYERSVVRLLAGCFLLVGCASSGASTPAPESVGSADAAGEAGTGASQRGRLEVSDAPTSTRAVAPVGAQPASNERGRVGDPAPLFYLRTKNPEACGLPILDLNELVGSDATAPRPVILSFAASDCRPCRLELAELKRRQTELAATGAVLAVVVMDATAEGRDEMLAFLTEELAIPFPIVEDPPGQMITRKYGVSSLPHTVVIGGSGLIGWVSRGYEGSASVDRLFRAVERVE